MNRTSDINKKLSGKDEAIEVDAISESLQKDLGDITLHR